MTDRSQRIDDLSKKLERLLKKQDEFAREISKLRLELNQLQETEIVKKSEQEKYLEEEVLPDSEIESLKIEAELKLKKIQQEIENNSPIDEGQSTKKTQKIKLNLEKFIGENLINKVGIVITIIGVVIGAKYAIDNQLISPVTRVILGYLLGVTLLGLAIRLKRNYENYSAVLLSGSTAIMYFITYAAYTFYHIIPQFLAFGIMVFFTVFTVVSAITYNRQVIAHIGLVGAYAIPFLLSNKTGNAAILFSYITIINTGILVIAIQKYWKSLYYSSFCFTWLIFILWYVDQFQKQEHFYISLIFLGIFFTIFYIANLIYKIVRNVKFHTSDIILILANSFIFYGLGYAIIESQESGGVYLGLFTIGNAIIHFAISITVYQQKLADKNLFYLVSGLAIVFITMAIPIELDSDWVTILWAGEATVLFWIGRTKNALFYERLSYLLMILAFISLLYNWSTVYLIDITSNPESRIMPLLNSNFLTTIIFAGFFGVINYLNYNKANPSDIGIGNIMPKIVSFTIPAVLIITLYLGFLLEIVTYWDQLKNDFILTGQSIVHSGINYYSVIDIEHFKNVWIINYSLLFFSFLSIVNNLKLKNRNLGFISLFLNVLTIVIFLAIGLYNLSQIRESYLAHSLSESTNVGVYYIAFRYISYSFVALTILSCYLYVGKNFMKKDLKMLFDILLHTTILWILTSELINWMDTAGVVQTDKLGISILWGIYALILITLGIWKNKKYLRIGAILLLVLTLIKLFFYDLAQLDTIPKTIVFVSVGTVLLIISFLYHKYKKKIAGESDT